MHHGVLTIDDFVNPKYSEALSPKALLENPVMDWHDNDNVDNVQKLVQLYKAQGGDLDSLNNPPSQGVAQDSLDAVKNAIVDATFKDGIG